MYNLLTWQGKNNLNNSKRHHTNNQLDLKFYYMGLWGCLGIMGREDIIDDSCGKEKHQKVSHTHPFLNISYRLTPELKKNSILKMQI